MKNIRGNREMENVPKQDEQKENQMLCVYI